MGKIEEGLFSFSAIHPTLILKCGVHPRRLRRGILADENKFSDFLREMRTESEVEKIKNGANPMRVSRAECEDRSTHINAVMIKER